MMIIDAALPQTRLVADDQDRFSAIRPIGRLQELFWLLLACKFIDNFVFAIKRFYSFYGSRARTDQDTATIR